MKSADFNKNEEILKQLQVILDAENPCNITIDAIGFSHCRDGKPCCTGCPLLTNTGCSNVPAECKFYFCPTAWASLTQKAKDELTQLGKDFVGILRFRGYRHKIFDRPPFVW